MAYLSSGYGAPDDEEQQKQQQQQGGGAPAAPGTTAPKDTGTGPIQLSEGPAPTTESGAAPTEKPATPPTGAPTGPTSQTAPTKSGSFTDIQQYLNANQGVGAALGQKAAGNITTRLNEAGQPIDSTVAAEKTAIDSGTNSYNPDVVAAYTADPTLNSWNVGGKTYSKSDIQRMLGSYAGPTTFDNGALTANIQGAVDYAGQAGSDAGRAALIREGATDKGRYTQGAGNLDNLFLTQQGGLEPLRQAAAGSGQLVDKANSSFAGIQDYLNKAQAKSNDARGQVTKAINDGVASTNTAIDAQVAPQIQAAQLQESINNKLTAGDYASLTPDEVASLGYSPGDWQTLLQLVGDANASTAAYKALYPKKDPNHPEYTYVNDVPYVNTDGWEAGKGRVLDGNYDFNNPAASGTLQKGDFITQQQADRINAFNAMLGNGAPLVQAGKFSGGQQSKVAIKDKDKTFNDLMRYIRQLGEAQEKYKTMKQGRGGSAVVPAGQNSILAPNQIMRNEQA